VPNKLFNGCPYPGGGYAAGDFIVHFAGLKVPDRKAAIRNYAAMTRCRPFSLETPLNELEIDFVCTRSVIVSRSDQSPSHCTFDRTAMVYLMPTHRF
jgi:hypothetical protein